MRPARTGEHPSAEEVDATLEPAGGARGVGEHVDSCERCRATRASLEHVRALLREESARVPEPPSGLGERIAAALDAQPATGRVVPMRARDVVPMRARDVVRMRARAQVPMRARRGVPSRWLAAAAGLAVLGAGAAVATQVVTTGTGVTAASEAGAESAPLEAQASAGDSAGAGGAGGSAAGPDPGADARDDATPESAAGSSPSDDEAGILGDATAAAPPAAPAALMATGTDYDPDRLPQQVATLVSSGRGGVPVAAAAGNRALADPARLQDCLRALGAAGDEPVTVDLARWEGGDAAVLVLPAGGGDAELQVWVVPRDCGAAGQDVLHSQRVAP